MSSMMPAPSPARITEASGRLRTLRVRLRLRPAGRVDGAIRAGRRPVPAAAAAARPETGTPRGAETTTTRTDAPGPVRAGSAGPPLTALALAPDAVGPGAAAAVRGGQQMPA